MTTKDTDWLLDATLICAVFAGVIYRLRKSQSQLFSEPETKTFPPFYVAGESWTAQDGFTGGGGGLSGGGGISRSD